LPKPVAQSSRASRKLALVVDDSLSARRALAQAVEDAGLEVRTARDGLEAVSMIEGRRPDLLLVDLEMPRMNGLELTAHVRGRDATRTLPVIMVTSRSTAKHRHEAEAAGVNFYMTKPFTDDDLLQNINSALTGVGVS
jgi:chemosensory pili system protein ChpA (sensor histidine kinase/response regulator)